MKFRWAMLAMGAWITGSVIVSVVATQNFYTIDRLLADSPSRPFHDAVGRLGEAQARDLLRYLSSELNRLYFQLWNGAQVLIGLLVIWLLAGNQSMRRVRLAAFWIDRGAAPRTQASNDHLAAGCSTAASPWPRRPLTAGRRCQPGSPWRD